MENLKLGTVLQAARNKTEKMKDLKDLLVSSATHQFTQAGIYTDPMLTDEQVSSSLMVHLENNKSNAVHGVSSSRKMDNTKPSQIFRAMSLYSLAILLTDIKEHGFNSAITILKEALCTAVSGLPLEFHGETVEFGKQVTTWPYTKGRIAQMTNTWSFLVNDKDLDGLCKSMDHVEIDDVPPLLDGQQQKLHPSFNKTPASNSMTALNYLLADVSQGVFKDYNDMLGKIEEAEDVASKALDKIGELNKELKIAKAAPKAAPSVIKSDGEIPNGTPYTANAQDVFGIQDTRLDREITCWKWDAANPKVPEVLHHYHFDIDTLSDFLWSMENCKNSWFKGHTGTGKTTFVQQVCARIGKMCFRLSCDVNIESYHVIGSKDIRVEDGKSISTFTEGVLPQAMQLPAQFIIDEADALRGDVSYLFQPVLERQPLRINEDGGRLVYPDPHFNVAATANSGGQGDDTGLYAAAVKMASAAQINRYHAFFEIDYMDADVEVNMIRQIVPTLSETSAQNLETFLRDYRKGFLEGTIALPISPRNSQTLAEYCAEFAPKVGEGTAFRRAVLINITKRAADMDAAKINELVERITKGETSDNEVTQDLNEEQPF
tara:strand:- start:12117 stop:13928 length:1812 start_codon:yes stop_codon:yes gene_type:complete